MTGKRYRIIRRYAATTVLGLALCGARNAATEASPLAVEAMSILESRCYECHDAESRKGGLSLWTREAALEGGDFGFPAFTPGDSADSELIDRVISDDDDYRMPPKDAALSPSEIATLKAWIDAGAPWIENNKLTRPNSKHWSFQPVVRPEPPSNAENPIDAFIRAQLQGTGLEPAPEADRRTLVRRAYLELVGLPPSPEEVDVFVADDSPEAYEYLVDRLLASPHYGERQARRWLDIARYADTNGYEKDRARSIWPYRDWVIDAYNQNLPYTSFVIEQLAGDLLLDATTEQRIATGFLRNSMFNEEGGIDAAEDWYKRTLDRANTTATAFLGLTMECAQCHTHKFDPITQREYFRFFAFFNDATETKLLLLDDDVRAKQERVQLELNALEQETVEAGLRDERVVGDYAAWLREARTNAVEWRILEARNAVSENGATLVPLDDGSILATEDVPNSDTYTVNFPLPDAPVSALRLEALPHDSLPGGGPGRGTILAEGDFLLSGFEAAVLDETGSETAIAILEASHGYAADDRSAEQALDGKADTGWSIKGATGQPHAVVFAFETPIHAPGAILRIVLRQDYIHQHTLGRFRISATDAPDGISASGLPADIETAALTNEAESPTIENASFRYFCLKVSKRLLLWQKQRSALRRDLPHPPSTLVMAPRAETRSTYLHNRGEFLEPREQVAPGTPEVLPPLPKDEPENRLTLAQWIVDPANPLTARVAMNRLWQQVFGQGIVATPGDFGTQGEQPTHAALLDWLADEFVRSGWDWKAMHRLLVTSATFRQASALQPGDLERDPGNSLLARGPRFRLDAETIRDIALSASGLLHDQIGGPSIYPPQPDGVTELAYGEPDWPASTGPARFRRGVYVYWKRTAPYAMASTFDAPTAEGACVRRRTSNTPLQALTLLNDRVFVEAAQAMAYRVVSDAESPEDRIAHAYELALSRPPTADERERLDGFRRTMMLRFKTDEPGAVRVAGPLGLLNPDQETELAVWTLICRAILNLDETITQG